MPDSIGPLSILILFVLTIALVLAGFYLGYSMKQTSQSRKTSNRTELILVALDLVLMALAVLCLLHDQIFGGIVFGISTTLVSGILWGRSDIGINGRWS